MYEAQTPTVCHLTDRQAIERQTERQTDRVCQACSYKLSKGDKQTRKKTKLDLVLQAFSNSYCIIHLLVISHAEFKLVCQCLAESVKVRNF
jgi:hypothetical protein